MLDVMVIVLDVREIAKVIVKGVHLVVLVVHLVAVQHAQDLAVIIVNLDALGVLELVMDVVTLVLQHVLENVQEVVLDVLVIVVVDVL